MPLARSARRARLALLATVAAGAIVGWIAPAAAQGCANVAVRSPLRGDAVRGVVRILGSARIDEFQFYKLEWAAAYAPEDWSAVSDVRTEPVVNGLLDQWDTTRVPDGRYRIALIVVDARADEVCRVVVDEIAVANRATPPAEGSATPSESVTAGAAATLIPSGPVPTSAQSPVRVTEDVGVRPTDTATATAVVTSETEGDATEPASGARRWLDVAAIGAALRAFAGGFAAALGVVLGALAIRALRRRP